MVKEHKFENMIVLCANCHGLKGEGPRRLDRKALRQYKENLSTANARYGNLEQRLLAILDDRERVNVNPEGPSVDFFPGDSRILVTAEFAEEMSRYLRLHHGLHDISIGNTSFERTMYRCLVAQGHQDVRLESECEYGLFGNNSRWLLKVERVNRVAGQVKIAKIVEGGWLRRIRSPEDCVLRVRAHVADGMSRCDRLLVLRVETRIDSFIYSLCEVPVDLLMQSMSVIESHMFIRKGSIFRGHLEHPGGKGKLFEMFLDPVTEKVGIWIDVNHCMDHGSWIVSRARMESK